MKKTLSILISGALLLSVANVAFAKNTKNYAPEMEQAVDGIYDVEGRADLKVKVFVHKEKARPGASVENLSCNLPDPDSSAVVGDAGWQLSTTTPVIYRLNLGSVPSSVGSANLVTIVNNSFNPWKTALALTSPTIVQGANTSVNRSKFDGQNIIAWGRTPGGTLGVTYVVYYIASGNVADVDTIMNNRVSWKWSNSNTCADPATYDAQNIMIHEIGHWFGLDDEKDISYANNTMYAYGSRGEVKKNTLTTGDITGIQNLY